MLLFPCASMRGGQQRLDAESETLIPTIGGVFSAQAPVGVTLHGTDGTASVASFTDLSSSLRSRIPSGVENSTTTAVMQQMQVRRLTPVECERLQGFPDDYTAIPWRRKPATECPDGPRYKALGNSWAVPVARWIGERINKVEAWTS